MAAQIGEATERDVVSAPGVNEALGVIKLRGIDPVLLVVDAGQEIACEGVERLMEGSTGVPVAVIVSRLRRRTFDSLRDGCAAYLVRPVSIGRVARVVAHFLDELP